MDMSSWTAQCVSFYRLLSNRRIYRRIEVGNRIPLSIPLIERYFFTCVFDVGDPGDNQVELKRDQQDTPECELYPEY
jgi:hypothetical protein